MYTSFALVGLHYGTGRHQEDLEESDYIWAIRVGSFPIWNMNHHSTRSLTNFIKVLVYV